MTDFHDPIATHRAALTRDAASDERMAGVLPTLVGLAALLALLGGPQLLAEMAMRMMQ